MHSRVRTHVCKHGNTEPSASANTPAPAHLRSPANRRSRVVGCSVVQGRRHLPIQNPVQLTPSHHHVNQRRSVSFVEHAELVSVLAGPVIELRARKVPLEHGTDALAMLTTQFFRYLPLRRTLPSCQGELASSPLHASRTCSLAHIGSLSLSRTHSHTHTHPLPHRSSAHPLSPQYFHCALTLYDANTASSNPESKLA